MLFYRGFVKAAVIAAFVQLENVTASTPLEEVRTVTTKIREELVSAFVRTRRPVTLAVVLQLPTNATGKIKKNELSSGTVEVILHESLQ